MRKSYVGAVRALQEHLETMVKNLKKSVAIISLTSALFLVGCVTPPTEYELCDTPDCAPPVGPVVE